MPYGLSMYVQGQGHEHMGPGTSLVQRINWTNGQEMQMSPGLGCACGCGNCSNGLGLFDSGFDPSTFGWPEWLVVGLGGYVLTSMFFGAKRGARAAGEGARRAVKSGRQRLAKRIAG